MKNEEKSVGGEGPKIEIKLDGSRRILITAVLDLAPFFEKSIEENFHKVRNDKDFIKAVMNCKDSGPFTKNDEQRDLEKKGYDIGVFRGIIYNDYFTPIYTIGGKKDGKGYVDAFKKSLFDDKRKWGIPQKENGNSEDEALSPEKKKEKVKQKALSSIHDELEEELKYLGQGLTLSVKISKAGVGYVFIEIDTEEGFPITPESFLGYKLFVRKWLESPIGKKLLEMEKQLENEIENLGEESDQAQNTKQALENTKSLRKEKTFRTFNSLLWTLAICSLHLFVEKTKIYEVVSKIVDKEPEIIPEENNDNTKTEKNSDKPPTGLKLPREVGYEEGKENDGWNPPIRNYFISYYVPNSFKYTTNGCEDSERINLTDVLKNLEIFADKGELSDPELESKVSKVIAGKLVSLLESTSVKEKKNKRFRTPKFSSKNIKGLVEKDFADWEDELCLIMSEATVISNPNITMLMSGNEIDSREYWECIVKGMGFILGGKVLAQVIHRMVTDCTQRFKDEQGKGYGLSCEVKKKRANTKERWGNLMKGKGFSREPDDYTVIREKLPSITNLLVRDRIAVSASMVSRGSWARVKFQRFIDETGVGGILANIQASFDELNDGWNNHLNFKNQFWMRFFALSSLIFGSLLVFGNLGNLKKVLCEIFGWLCG